ncbi:MAG: hypothetical protein GQ569_06615 [Methylococcaceae bacterium]|nr:hypothetical protein [Methylococcaceae bacterium]
MISKEITEKAKALFNGECLGPTITNEIFLVIQNNNDLMQEYLRAVEEVGLDTINPAIGKSVKELYDLENDGNKRENNPSSTLIQSHQKFK